MSLGIATFYFRTVSEPMTRFFGLKATDGHGVNPHQARFGGRWGESQGGNEGVGNNMVYLSRYPNQSPSDNCLSVCGHFELTAFSR